MSSTKSVAKVLAVCFGETATIHLKTGYNGAVTFWDSKQVHAARELPGGLEHVLMSVRGVPEARANWIRKEAGKRPIPPPVEELDAVSDLERRLGELFNGSGNATVATMSTSTTELIRKGGLVQSRLDGLKATIEEVLTIVSNELAEIRCAAEAVHFEQSAMALRLKEFEDELQLTNDMKALFARHRKDATV